VAQPEALLQLGDLSRHGGRIGGIALEHLDRDRTAVGGAQQADHQLRPVGAAVTAVAVAGQRTATSLEVGGGDIVEHQHAILEMTACEAVFDEALFAAEPVEGGVDLARGDAAEAKHFAQRVAGGGGVEHPGGGQFGGRIEQPGDDQSQRQVAPPLGGTAGQQIVETDAPGDGQRAKDVAMWEGAADFETVVADGSQFVATQQGAEQFDPLAGPIGQIGQCAVLGLAGFAVAFPEQDGGRRASVGDGCTYMLEGDQTESRRVNGFLSCYMTT
jgi:hypothetical protein